MAKRQITNIEVKKNNRNRIFRYICEHSTISNPDISYDLKISLPTVTQNTKELIERGLVEEAGELQSTGGRRAKALSVASYAKLAVGLDITKNHIGLVLTNLVGAMLKYERTHLSYENKESYYKEVNRRLEAFLEDFIKSGEDTGVERERILGIGISFPGIVNLQKEVITYSHVLGVESLPFADVSRYFSFPCHFVNDANAGAYAEGLRSEAPVRFFYLSLSNTVGGAVFSQGELIQGENYHCGEVGHMTIVPDGAACYCKKLGCLDAYCSAKCLAEMTDGRLESFFEGLNRGEKEFADRWDKYTTYLAIAVNNVHMVLDCDIVLGGYVGSCLENHMGEIWEKVSGRNTFAEDRAFVKPCLYKVGAAPLGAALNVIENFIEQV